MQSAYSVLAVGSPSRLASNAAPFFHFHLSATSVGSLDSCRKSWAFGASRQPVSAMPARCTQPSSSSQVSNVHTLLSSHSVTVPPPHTPPVQVSPFVQASVSAQALPFGSFVVQLSPASS